MPRRTPAICTRACSGCPPALCAWTPAGPGSATGFCTPWRSCKRRCRQQSPRQATLSSLLPAAGKVLQGIFEHAPGSEYVVYNLLLQSKQGIMSLSVPDRPPPCNSALKTCLTAGALENDVPILLYCPKPAILAHTTAVMRCSFTVVPRDEIIKFPKNCRCCGVPKFLPACGRWLWWRPRPAASPGTNPIS